MEGGRATRRGRAARARGWRRLRHPRNPERSGSPFADVEHDGKRHVVGQANNVFIFPGVGLATAIAEAEEVTTDMFQVAAATLAGLVSQERLDAGAIYPHQSELRRVSFERYASEHNLGRRIAAEDVEAAVRAVVWDPSYIPVRHG